MSMLMLDANVNWIKEACHYSYMIMWIKLSRHVILLTWLCWLLQGCISLMLSHYAWSVDTFQSLSLPLSHPDSFCRCCLICGWCKGILIIWLKSPQLVPCVLLPTSSFQIRGSLCGLLQPGPTVALQKPQRCLMVHIVGLLPWWCFEAIWKSSGELKLRKWHHDCIINHKM